MDITSKTEEEILTFDVSDEALEMVTKKAEAHLFLPRDRNKCLDVTSVEEEPNPQPKAARPVPEEAISLSKW